MEKIVKLTLNYDQLNLLITALNVLYWRAENKNQAVEANSYKQQLEAVKAALDSQ